MPDEDSTTTRTTGALRVPAFRWHLGSVVAEAMAAARVAVDDSLGDETPQWIRDLAEKPLPPYGR